MLRPMTSAVPTLQEKMRTWSRQLEELTSQVAQLKMDKQELQQRNRILESSLTVNTHHEERLHCNEVCVSTGDYHAAPRASQSDGESS